MLLINNTICFHGEIGKVSTLYGWMVEREPPIWNCLLQVHSRQISSFGIHWSTCPFPSRATPCWLTEIPWVVWKYHWTGWQIYWRKYWNRKISRHSSEARIRFCKYFLFLWSRGVDTLSGEATLSEWVLLPSEKGSTLNGKNLLPRGANSFLLE